MATGLSYVGVGGTGKSKMSSAGTMGTKRIGLRYDVLVSIIFLAHQGRFYSIIAGFDNFSVVK